MRLAHAQRSRGEVLRGATKTCPSGLWRPDRSDWAPSKRNMLAILACGRSQKAGGRRVAFSRH
eukprot:2554311-Rhodomonas_salina.1